MHFTAILRKALGSSYYVKYKKGDKEKLLAAVEKHGEDWPTIRSLYFPDWTISLLRMRYSDRNPPSSQSPLNGTEILAIVGKVLSIGRSITWLDLASKLNRPHEYLRIQYYNKARVEIRCWGRKSGKNFDQSLRAVYRELSTYNKDTANAPAGGFIKRAPLETNWTPEKQTRMRKLVWQVGGSFNSLYDDYPETSAVSLRQEYAKSTIKTVFLPEDDQILSDLPKLSEPYPMCRLIKNLPGHNLDLARIRLKELKDGKALRPDQIDQISAEVAKAGRSYFHTILKDQYLGWSRQRLIEQWAICEPFNQINPVWTLAVDEFVLPPGADIQKIKFALADLRRDELVSYSMAELRNRYAFLSYSERPDIVERRRINQNNKS